MIATGGRKLAATGRPGSTAQYGQGPTDQTASPAPATTLPAPPTPRFVSPTRRAVMRHVRSRGLPRYGVTYANATGTLTVNPIPPSPSAPASGWFRLRPAPACPTERAVNSPNQSNIAWDTTRWPMFHQCEVQTHDVQPVAIKIPERDQRATYKGHLLGGEQKPPPEPVPARPSRYIEHPSRVLNTPRCPMRQFFTLKQTPPVRRFGTGIRIRHRFRSAARPGHQLRGVIPATPTSTAPLVSRRRSGQRGVPAARA